MTDASTDRPSPAMRFVSALLPALRYKPIMSSEARTLRNIADSEGGRFAAPPAAYRREFRMGWEKLGPLHALVVEPRSAPASARSLVWLHGGGYIHQFETAHWWLVASLVRELGVRVIAPDYLLAPNGTGTRAVAEVASLLEAVAQRDGVAPVLAGDSAGGGLAVSTALGLRGTAAAPAHLVLAAPWLDVTLRHPEVPDLDTRDPSLAALGLRIAGRLWAAELDPADALVSPAFAADYVGLPATSLVLGTRDLLYPDARDFQASARTDGVDVASFTAIEGFHVFFAASRLPEARAARAWLAARLADYWVV
ncbi:alpha/beta hydrolase fold domain-containing protein [Gryllotalpicola protaetiae]|uniref:Steryl acetyl hydrolase n=1 Tax=Gryllotalpicola protaetiae TaxID=2419771 RepID=A0A387BR77_9MICO|nr:alpha/beta hydrolase fold domain-containing protein [Gryllotalpicola protaetiae]AYG03559.1 steryl acetyl hydrolase [Gryllotalpicola protaetiae]